MMCGGMMLLLIPGAISNSNAVIRQEFRKLRFQMIDDMRRSRHLTSPQLIASYEVSLPVAISPGC